MNKIVSILLCSVVSVLAYGNSDITLSKDNTKLYFKTNEAYKNFLEHTLKRTILLPPNPLPPADCDSTTFLRNTYNSCFKDQVPDYTTVSLTVDEKINIEFSIAAYCTLSTSLSSSYCKGEIGPLPAGAFLEKYIAVKEFLNATKQDPLITTAQSILPQDKKIKKTLIKDVPIKDVQKDIFSKENLKDDCNAEHCSKVYVECIVYSRNAKEAVDVSKKGTDKEINDVAFDIVSSCTLLTAFSCSYCKDENGQDCKDKMTKKLATTLFFDDYYKTKDGLKE